MKSQSIEVTSKMESITAVKQFIAEFMGAMSFGPEEILRFELAIEEACTNVILHAYGDGQGPLRVSLKGSGDDLIVTLEDEGLPLDPTEHFQVTEGAPVGSYPVGRWGITLIKALSDEMAYHRLDNRNILQLTKKKLKR